MPFIYFLFADFTMFLLAVISDTWTKANAHSLAQTHLLVGCDCDEQHDTAGSKAQGDGVGEDLQYHSNCQHNHVIDDEVDVKHVPAGEKRQDRRGQKSRMRRQMQKSKL